MRLSISRRRFLALCASSLLAGGALIAKDTSIAEVREVEVGTSLGITAMVVTDLHLHGWGWREGLLREELVRIGEEVDLVFVLGDSYDQSTPNLKIVEEMLKALDGPKFGVLGNHEHWASSRFPLEEGVRMYGRSGVELILDSLKEFEGVKIGGVDWFSGLKSVRGKLRDMGRVDVLLSHTPDVIGASPEAGAVVSGHTHGGQICLPIVGPMWVPSRYGTKYASGLFDLGDLKLYISRGLGEAAILPIRFNCPREITILHL